MEFRHKSWWNGVLYRALRRRRIILCAVSAPRIPDKLVRTADDIYVRLHGTTKWYRHDYTDEQLAEWAEKIRTSGAKRAWIYFDNDRDAFSIKNAKTLRRMLKEAVNDPFRRPKAQRQAALLPAANGAEGRSAALWPAGQGDHSSAEFSGVSQSTWN